MLSPKSRAEVAEVRVGHRPSISQWKLQLRVMIYRTHAQHETQELPTGSLHPGRRALRVLRRPRTLALGLPALYAFVCGRGAQEKTLGELKGEFALDVVLTRQHLPLVRRLEWPCTGAF